MNLHAEVLTRSRSDSVAFKAPSGRPKGKQYLQTAIITKESNYTNPTG